jgi:hypothetical protein
MITRRFPGQVGDDGRPGEPRVGDEAGPDHMAELDQPSARTWHGATAIRRSSACALVRLDEDLDVAELDRVRHQQAERGNEQRGDLGLAHVGRRDIHPEPVSGQATAVAEADGGVEGGTVLSHAVSVRCYTAHALAEGFEPSQFGLTVRCPAIRPREIGSVRYADANGCGICVGRQGIEP